MKIQFSLAKQLKFGTKLCHLLLCHRPTPNFARSLTRIIIICAGQKGIFFLLTPSWESADTFSEMACSCFVHHPPQPCPPNSRPEFERTPRGREWVRSSPIGENNSECFIKSDDFKSECFPSSKLIRRDACTATPFVFVPVAHRRSRDQCVWERLGTLRHWPSQRSNAYAEELRELTHRREKAKLIHFNSGGAWYTVHSVRD